MVPADGTGIDGRVAPISGPGERQAPNFSGSSRIPHFS
jgi:hypothetical protein